jgi:hypothetical protein
LSFLWQKSLQNRLFLNQHHRRQPAAAGNKFRRVFWKIAVMFGF